MNIESLKICMLSPTGLTLASARHLLSAAHLLAGRGLNISLVVPNHYYFLFDADRSGEDESSGGVKVKHAYLPARWRGSVRTHLFPLGYWTWKMVKRAMEEPFDVIHVMKSYYTSSPAGLLLHLLTGKPMVLECDDLEGKNGWGKSLAEEPLLEFKTHLTGIYERRIPLLADAVIADTMALFDMFRGYGVEKDRLFYIPYCVEDYMLRQGNGERIRQKLGLGESPVAVYCGALHPHNYDCDLLIGAMKEVHGKLPEAKMLIVGDGGAKPQLEEASRELGLLDRTVIFAGWVPFEEIPDFIAAADVGVVPMRNTAASRSRGLSKVLEYLCQERPVVIPGIGQAGELTDGGKGGYLVEPGTPDALAAGILDALSRPDRRREKGRLGKEHVLKRFARKGATERLLDVYRTVTGRRKS